MSDNPREMTAVELCALRYVAARIESENAHSRKKPECTRAAVAPYTFCMPGSGEGMCCGCRERLRMERRLASLPVKVSIAYGQLRKACAKKRMPGGVPTQPAYAEWKPREPTYEEVTAAPELFWRVDEGRKHVHIVRYVVASHVYRVVQPGEDGEDGPEQFVGHRGILRSAPCDRDGEPMPWPVVKREAPPCD